MCYYVYHEEAGVTSVCVILFNKRRLKLPVYMCYSAYQEET